MLRRERRAITSSPRVSCSRFVPSEIPWVHVDLSAGQHKAVSRHVPSEITGFGVRFTLELLARHDTRRARRSGGRHERGQKRRAVPTVPRARSSRPPTSAATGIAGRFRGFLPVIVDVETGGFNPATDALLEVAAVLVRLRRRPAISSSPSGIAIS